MACKGDKTKGEILKAAKRLFIQKGYEAVSMSDLCTATGLSRGGLYRHYASTEEVFSDLLMSDKADWEEQLEGAIRAGNSAASMLAYFLERAKVDIKEGAGRLSLAIYEYDRSTPSKHGFLVQRYKAALDMMERLLRYGQSRGEFHAFDPAMEAEHLVIFLDGLKMASAALCFPEEAVAKQLDMLLARISITGGFVQ